MPDYNQNAPPPGPECAAEAQRSIVPLSRGAVGAAFSDYTLRRWAQPDSLCIGANDRENARRIRALSGEVVTLYAMLRHLSEPSDDAHDFSCDVCRSIRKKVGVA